MLRYKKVRPQAERDQTGVPLFVSQHRRRIDPSTVRKFIKRYAQESGRLDNRKRKSLSPHKLRHTFATLCCRETSISGTFKSSWGTRTCQRLKSTPVCVRRIWKKPSIAIRWAGSMIPRLNARTRKDDTDPAFSGSVSSNAPLAAG